MLKQTNMESKGDPLGIVSSNKPTELLWLHGIKIQVLDEHDKLLPTAEFICHMNLDVDLVTRYTAFPELEKTGFERMITLTQGQTEFYFPEGYAVPVSSDEEWKFTFQAANRTTNKHRRIKQVCTLSFLQDADLKSPPKALHWFNPYISVQSSDNSAAPHHMGPDCMQFSTGTNAPNMVPGSEFKNQSGVTMLPHWAVPPGSHTYTIPLSGAEDKDLGSSDQVIHAVWTHLHPACARAALIECTGRAKRAIFDVHAETSYNPGAELKHIDTILSPKGIAFKAGQNYELLATYDNPSKSDLDSMVVFGIFCESKSFVKPAWLKDQNLLGGTSSSNGQADCDRYCGIKHSNK